uniref:Uncharacterized protein n=1 Tax=Photinus pyralis TaxID=7054 RepID=A0A1Y1KWU0_PHOPY
MWVDLPIDNEERVSEAIVQMLVSQFVNSIEPEKRLLIINPQVPLQQNLMEAISLTEVCKKYCKQQEKVASIDCDKIIKKSKYITVVERLSSEQFKEVIADQRKEAAEIKEVVCLNNDQKLLQDYVDSILDEDVIAIIKRKIWKL